jgi:DEAD/DEAH box helicase domain-containing protein
MNVVMGFPFGENLQQSFYIPSRAAQHIPIPRHLHSGAAGRWIGNDSRFDKGLWKHQGIALHNLHAGENIVLTSSTGSGKTTPFHAHVLHLLDQNPNATVFALYTAKALQSDQLQKWRQTFRRGGLNPNSIGIINGDEKDEKIRNRTLEKSRLVAITPDVIQAWLMGGLANPQVRDFLGNLELLVLDETQVYNGIFGSHAMLLFKRLQFVVDAIKKQQHKESKPLQMIAASASLHNAPAFVKQLTGQDFVEIGAEHDGSEKHDQDVVHLAAAKGSELAVAKSLILKFLTAADENSPGTGVCFIDSRRAVEKLASDINARLGTNSVAPFIGTYTRDARDEIQLEIKKGKRRFIICTSVIEMGVDFSEMAVGISVGKPDSPTSLPQRIGRVGRGRKGLFVIIAPPDAFTKGKHPIPLKDICSGGLAKPIIYPDNQRILAWHAICLQKEIELLGLPPDTALNQRRYKWSDSFMDIMAKLRAGKPIFDEDMAEQIRPRRGKPHTIFGLRNLELGHDHRLQATMLDGSTANLGTVSRRQAVFECYPGAILIHRLRKFEVQDWSFGEKGNVPTIRLRQVHTPYETYPRMEKWVNFAADMRGLPGSHPIVKSRGSIVELKMSVSERVVGYIRYRSARDDRRSDSAVIYYDKEKSKTKRRAKDTKEIKNIQHYTATSGVLFNFRNTAFEPEELTALADAIKNAYCEKFNVAPRDVDYATSRIYQNTAHKPLLIPNSLVIYDSSSNGLRLTSRLTQNIDQILLGMAESSLNRDLLNRFSTFCQSLRAASSGIDIPEASVTEHASTEAHAPAFPIKSLAWYENGIGVTKRAKANDNLRGKAAGQWVVIEGFERVGSELMYQISAWDDPTRPKKRQRNAETDTKHFVLEGTLSKSQP